MQKAVLEIDMAFILRSKLHGEFDTLVLELGIFTGRDITAGLECLHPSAQ